MEIIKKVIFRILALALFLFLANLLYTKTFWESDILKHADLLDSIAIKQNNTDVLYLSSSSNYFCPSTDTSKSTISEYLNLYFPKLRINSIHKGYMHSGVFFSVLENIPQDSPIETIIISINLRSFGAYWLYSEVESNYSAQKLMMEPNYPPLLKRFLLSLNHFDNKSKKERESQFLTSWTEDTLKSLRKEFPYKTVMDWDHAIAKSIKYKNEDGSINYEETGFACNIVKAFAFEINNNHPRIKDLDRIVELSKKRKWNLIFHILPEDFEKAERMIGSEIPFMLTQAKNIITDRFKEEDLQFVNNLDILNASFFYEKYPTEHYNSVGKRIIAQKLSNALSFFYPKEYTDLKWEPNLSISDSIFNNAEPIILKSDSNLGVNTDTTKNMAIESIISRINSDSKWKKLIQEKAKKNNISYQKQVQLDAEWLFTQEKK